MSIIVLIANLSILIPIFHSHFIRPSEICSISANSNIMIIIIIIHVVIITIASDSDQPPPKLCLCILESCIGLQFLLHRRLHLSSPSRNVMRFQCGVKKWKIAISSNIKSDSRSIFRICQSVSQSFILIPSLSQTQFLRMHLLCCCSLIASLVAGLSPPLTHSQSVSLTRAFYLYSSTSFSSSSRCYFPSSLGSCDAMNFLLDSFVLLPTFRSTSSLFLPSYPSRCSSSCPSFRRYIEQAVIRIGIADIPVRSTGVSSLPCRILHLCNYPSIYPSLSNINLYSETHIEKAMTKSQIFLNFAF